MDATIIDPVEGRAALVNGSGQLKVEAAVPSTVNVNVSSQSAPLETTPSDASSVSWGQVDVDTTSGGIEIIANAGLAFRITNMSLTLTVFLGFGSNPDATTGFPLLPGDTFVSPDSVAVGTQVKGITNSGTARVGWWKAT